MTTKSSLILLPVALAVAGFLGGCASPVKLDAPAPVESRPTASAPAPQSQSGITTVDTTGGKPVSASNLDRVIYFDFDSYVVKDDYRAIVEANAAVLKADKARKEVAEGHTDERGGSEYNLALGQKRAEAVVKQMVLLGAADGQLEAVSYGKERPAAPGHDEDSWAKNRRVELRSK